MAPTPPAGERCGCHTQDEDRATRAELAAEEECSAGDRAHYEHERERADLLARSHEKLDIQLKNLRLLLQAGRQVAAPRTLRHWWRWLRASGTFGRGAQGGECSL